jgi:hypothetical protein
MVRSVFGTTLVGVVAVTVTGCCKTPPSSESVPASASVAPAASVPAAASVSPPNLTYTNAKALKELERELDGLKAEKPETAKSKASALIDKY